MTRPEHACHPHRHVLAMMRFGAAVETASQTAELLADHG
jgi:hypothetical protein